jgi:hypothetical protein
MTELTEARIAEIEARANAATEGPWQASWDTFEDTDTYRVEQKATELVIRTSAESYETDNDELFGDIDFIAHARTDIPDLLDEVKRLREELRERDAGVARGRALSSWS